MVAGTNPVRVVVALLVIPLSLVGYAALSGRGDAGDDDGTGEVAADVVAVRDSIAADRAAVQRLLAWFEEREAGSSATLLNDLRRLDTPHLISGDESGLVLLEHCPSLSVAEDEVVHAYRLLRERLDRELQPGVWYHLNGLDTGPHDVDFRGALRDLDAAGFETSLRTLLRALHAQQRTLSCFDA